MESRFGALVDATEYVENVPEGEFVTAQANKGQTLATGTDVPETFADGTANDYYPAWKLMKRYCDEDFDLVFTTSFGFMSQTVDVAGGYAPCGTASDGGSHTTHFVHASGYRTNARTSTVFGMIYQARYHAGLTD